MTDDQAQDVHSRAQRTAAWVHRLRRWEDHEDLSHREAADLADLLDGYASDTGAGPDSGRQLVTHEQRPPSQKRHLPAGWGWPGQSRKAHYFPEGSLDSLCGRWGFFAGMREPDDRPSSDDCTPCRRKLDAR